MSEGGKALILSGRNLTPAAIAEIARDGRAVAIDATALKTMGKARAVVEHYLDQGTPVYGLNTGLGARVKQEIPKETLQEFSRMTLRGRSNAVGPPLAVDEVRAIMAVRLNNLLTGAAGAAPGIAEALAALLNAGIHPVIPSIGTIGAGDLCILAHLGLGLIGEGDAEVKGARLPAREALAQAGLEPVTLGPKDGLAICNASAATVGLAALALHDGKRAYDLANIAAALSMEGFRANVSPLDERMAALRPQPGQEEAARALRDLLGGGTLLEPGAARRLQDPLSLRCVAPVHGALKATLDFATTAVGADINGESTNPLVFVADGEILSTANFHTPLIAVALDALSQALSQVASLAASRLSRLLIERMSGLPANLSPHGQTRSGFAPLLKPAEALVSEIAQLALPSPGGLSLSAEGVEDHKTNAPQSARRVGDIIWRLRLLLAMELIVAAQAVDLRNVDRLGTATARVQAAVRGVVAPLDEDRAHGPDVERLEAELLVNGTLIEILHAGN